MKNFVQTGDNLAFLASELVHPAHAAGDTYTNLVGPASGITTPITLVESGDPVVCGQIVGVANQDALQSTDSIVISTRGVYNLSVHGANGSGNVAVAKGDQLYIDGTTAVISKVATGVPFGKALAAVASSATTVIPVKVQNS